MPIKNLGFSLLELAVVVAILGTLVVVAIPNINGFNNDRKLKEAAFQLQSDIRIAQNNAISGVQCTSVSALSWRVVFTGTTAGTENYRIEAQCLGDPTTTQTVKSVTLPNNLKLVSVVNQTGGSDICTVTPASGNTPYISFTNVSTIPTFYFGDLAAGCTPAADTKMVVVLGSTVSSNTLKIYVEPGGSVNVQ